MISLPHPETLTMILSLFQCLEYTDCSPVSLSNVKLSSRHQSDRFISALKGFLVLQKNKDIIYYIRRQPLIYFGHCNRSVTIVFMATPTDCFRAYKKQQEGLFGLVRHWNGCIPFIICAVQPSASPSLSL